MANLKVQCSLLFLLSIEIVFADWNDADFRSIDGVEVDRIRFVYKGNKLVKNGVLRAAMRSREGEPFVRQAFKEDLVTIVNLYQSRGYRSARIPRKNCQINTKGDQVRLLIEVESGPLWHVKKMSVKTADGLMDSVLLGLTGLKDGMPLNYERILEGERVIQVYLNQAGYPHAQVRNEWINEDARSHNVEILYNVDIGRKMYFGKLTIENLDRLHTAPSLFSSYVKLRSGELYDPEKLAVARNALAGSDLFRTVLINTPRVAQGDSIQPIFIRVQERKYKSLSANLLMNSSQRSIEPRLTGSAEHRNWFGRGLGIGLHTSWGRPIQGLTVSFTDRDVLRSNIDWVLTVGVNEEWNRKRVFADPTSVGQFQFLRSTDGFLNQLFENAGRLAADDYVRNATYDYESKERLWSLQSVLSRRWEKFYEAQVSFSLSEAYNRPSSRGRINYEPVDSFRGDFDVFDQEIPVNSFWQRILSEKTRSVSLASQLLRDTRDDRITPKEGLFVRFEGIYALELGGEETSVFDSEIECRIYRRLSSRFIFALAAQAVRTVSMNSDGSLPQLYWKAYGGEGSLRGVERNFIQVAGGGRSGLNLRSELRGQWGALGSVIFWDRAQVWPRFLDARPLSLNGMVDGVGFGLRYVYGFPFRLDVAINDGFDLSQRMRFYFSIGQAF